MLPPRGVFIVLEGIDGAGKTTQAKRIGQYFQTQSIPHRIIAFPERTSPTGVLIDAYLRGKKQLDPHCCHLLFSANRWEQQKSIRDLLESGISIICDRYLYSGTAYSVGSKRLDLQWCLQPDGGLLEPDVVYYLMTDPETCSKREGFGNEVEERLDIQRRVAKVYQQFFSCLNFHCIDTAALTYRSSSAAQAPPMSPHEQTSFLEVNCLTTRSIQNISEALLQHLKGYLTSKTTRSMLEKRELKFFDPMSVTSSVEKHNNRCGPEPDLP